MIYQGTTIKQNAREVKQARLAIFWTLYGSANPNDASLSVQTGGISELFSFLEDDVSRREKLLSSTLSRLIAGNGFEGEDPTGSTRLEVTYSLSFRLRSA